MANGRWIPDNPGRPSDQEYTHVNCTHNASRSQMAEGLLRTLAGDRYDVYSAGTEPSCIHPLAVSAMSEIGIDLSEHRSEHVNAYGDVQMDFVVTVCGSAREPCPYVPAQEKVIHQSFEDPSAAQASEEERLAVFRQVHDEIKGWLESTFIRQSAVPE